MSTGKYSSELKVAFRRHPLDAIFKPRNVAVIGATEKEDSVGRTLLWNLIRNPFGGTVFSVNPKRSNILGIRAYPSIREVPDQVDLAVLGRLHARGAGILGHRLEFLMQGELLDPPRPQIDPEALKQDEIELMLQVNGKLRGAIVVPAAASKEDIEQMALASEAFLKHSGGGAIKRVIVVPGRLVNVVVA